MTESFKLQDYTFILTRKNDTALTISATPELNKSMFESGLVELKKVKCDTVSAALGNSNSKNLASNYSFIQSKSIIKRGISPTLVSSCSRLW